MIEFLPQTASRHDLAVLRHPDRRTNWVSAASLTLAEPLPNLLETLDRRLQALCVQLPMLGARLRRETWHPGSPPAVTVLGGEPLISPLLLAPFALADMAPIRLLTDGRARVAVAAHHAAFDGRGLIGVLAALLGAPPPLAAEPAAPGPADGPWPAVRRMLRPADPIAPSSDPGPRDALAVRAVTISGPDVSARIAAACIGAAAARNKSLGRRFARVGLSIGVGGPRGVGNVATYRRLDLRRGEEVVPAVREALASAATPPELVSAPRAMALLLAPVAERFSDSLLVSNPGRQALPGVARLENFPVARGRSAVAFGSCGIEGGTSTLSIRARDLDQADAEALLEDAAERLEGG